MSEKNICLLGFSKKIEDKLRAIIKKNSKLSGINWVSANAQSLDAVVINSQHLKNPQVQKFISITTCPCLCAYSNASKPDSTKLMSLNIDEPSQTDSLWFSILLSSDYSEDRKSEDPSASFSGSEDLLDAIMEKRHHCILAKYDKSETIIFPMDEVVLIDYPRENIVGINLWQWKPSTPPTNQDAWRKMKLEQWLFESIWQANGQKYSVPNHQKFSLVKWPQPLSREGRTEALRIAAVIKLAPANISEILSKTRYNKEIVERFLYAGIVSRQIAVHTDNTSNKVNAQKISLDEQEIQKKKSLLGRLRSKLGLG